MEFEYRKLRERIKEVYKTEQNFAKALSIGRVSLSKRLNNELDFSRMEILRACELLGIEPSEASRYFFSRSVQEHEQMSKLG